MKKTALTMAISSLLLAGGAQASTVYNQDGTKLDIGGRVQGMYYGSDNDELRYAYAGIKHDRFGAFSYGRQDGLFTKAVNNYTDVLPEWGGDGLGKDT